MRSAQRDAERSAKKTALQANKDLERRLGKVMTDANKDAERRARRLQSRPSSTVQLSDSEAGLAERVYAAAPGRDDRDYDIFLSYTRSDGSEVATELTAELEELGVEVWLDSSEIIPGRSQALQMDRGLRLARAGVVVLTPAYLEGRFWPERELAVLLGKPTLIPVLHGVTFADVARYSGMLPDLAGFTTKANSVIEIAEKIALALQLDEAA